VLLLVGGCSDDQQPGHGSGADLFVRDLQTPDSKACMAGAVLCGKVCVDTATDSKNCGGCGKNCGAGQVCVKGTCSIWCPTNQAKCGGGDGGVAYCANLKTDNTNCGACGMACAAGQVCSAGKCALSCQAGLTNCGGTCTNLKSDNSNCGKCGAACLAGQVCSTGTCTLSCQAGLINCGGTCVDLKTSPANCGACGKACLTGQVCSGGKCALTCQQGQTNCGSACVDLQKSTSHCGKCGAKCKVGEVCVGGVCKNICGNGKLDTGEQCDGSLLAGKTCKSFNYYGGTLSCTKKCRFDSSKCDNCGNGKLDSGELCDTGISSGAGACPTSCVDTNPCTKDTLLGAGTCQAKCSFPACTCVAHAEMLLDGKQVSKGYLTNMPKSVWPGFYVHAPTWVTAGVKVDSLLAKSLTGTALMNEDFSTGSGWYIAAGCHNCKGCGFIGGQLQMMSDWALVTSDKAALSTANGLSVKYKVTWTSATSGINLELRNKPAAGAICTSCCNQAKCQANTWLTATIDPKSKQAIVAGTGAKIANFPTPGGWHDVEVRLKLGCK